MDIAKILADYKRVRADSLKFCETLELDDYCLQAEPFTSPPKWHLAHTTWFFETFILKVFKKNYQPFDEHFEVLFNSYYNGIGEQFSRPKRGLLTRPTLAQVKDYRSYVDSHIEELLCQGTLLPELGQISERCILGMQHEKQHQELFFMDIKYSFFQNPLYPALFDTKNSTIDKQDGNADPIEWIAFSESLCEIGVDENDGHFHFDNEVPKHKYQLNGFEIANRLVTNIEYLEFIQSGGYDDPKYWLADGWAWRQENKISCPLYWIKRENDWYEFTLFGLEALDGRQPVCHISAYEADAYASWSNARLVTEQEWEHAAKSLCSSFPDGVSGHPKSLVEADDEARGLSQLFGHCWQWTGTAYRPYPGFKAVEGAIGEYNGKFMSNQWVLRGSACVTPENHARATYRNFFYPQDRWQFSGIRLARTL